MKFNPFTGFTLLILLITSLRANNNFILRATHNGIDLIQYTENIQRSTITKVNCRTKKINQIWAFPANCLQNRNSLTVYGKSAHGIRLRYWREKNDQDAEYYLAYQSRISKNTTLKLFNSFNQPKQKWVTQDIYLHDLIFVDGKTTLNFNTNDVEIFRYIKTFQDPGSPYITNFTDPERYKLKPFHPFSDINQHGLFRNEKIWIHQIEWFSDSFADQKVVKQKYLNLIQTKHKTFFQKTKNQLLIATLFICALGIALWAVTRYLQIQLISSLIMPTTLVIIFMTKPMIEYFESFEQIKLQKIQQEIETVYTNIKQSYNLALHRVHQKISVQKNLLQDAINNSKFFNQKPILKPIPNLEELSLSQLTQEIYKLRQNQKEQLLDQINTRLGEDAYNFYLPRVELKYASNNSKKQPTGNRDYLKQEYLQLTFQNSPVSQTLRYLESTTGLDLKLSNSKCVIEAHTFNEGFNNQSGIESPLMSQILHNLRRTPLETSQIDKEHRKAVIFFNQKISKLGLNPQFISDYMNQPNQWHKIGTSRNDDTIKLHSWQLIDAKNGPWILLMNMNLSTVIKEMDVIIRDQDLQKLTIQNISKSGILSENQKSKEQSQSMDYFFLGEKNRESFPLYNDHSYLSKAASLAKIKATPIMMPIIKGQRSYVAMGFPMDMSPAYSLAIGREVTSDWKSLLDLKSRIQWFIFVLILSPLLLASNISGRITKPLKQIGKAVYEIARGRYKTKLNLSNIDEFSKLGMQFNEMSVALQKGEELTSFISDKSLHDILKTDKTSNREEVTILFCGLHNFQDYHKIDPRLAQKYFENFILINQRIINSNQGIVDKFTGIAILAIFRESSKEKLALNSAEAIKNSIQKFNAESDIQFRVGIGIASGPVILGQVGADKRKDFTCIGNTVNMAARLEALSSNSNSQITIYLDQSTLKANSELNIQIKELTPTKIKGKQELQNVYELVSIQ